VHIPVEILFSDIKGGVFETDGYTGQWWRGGKLVAEWKRVKGKAVVTWHQEN
jgi:hypothetical protein